MRTIWAFAVVACVATAVAFGLRSGPAIRAAVFVDVLAASLWLGLFLGWPPALSTALICVLPLAALIACGRFEALRPVTPWLARGRISQGMVWLGIAAVLVSAGALVAWTLVVRPDEKNGLDTLRDLPTWVSVFAVLGFALVNPIWEEVLFRGVLLTELRAFTGVWTAVVVQAVLFGTAHFHGFPSGISGSLMAGGWGLALGIMRVRTNGLLLPYVVHFAADFTIGTLAVTLSAAS